MTMKVGSSSVGYVIEKVLIIALVALALIAALSEIGSAGSKLADKAQCGLSNSCVHVPVHAEDTRLP